MRRAIVLAQQSSPSAMSDALWMVALLIGALVLGGSAALLLRRRMLRRGEAAAGGLLLDDLRAMRRRGEITEEEYEAARVALLGRYGGAETPRPAPRADDGVRVARPGYDLTGERLPDPGGGDDGGRTQ